MFVVVYDIPETRKNVRQKFRRQLESWNFQPVQKSVWRTDSMPEGFEQILLGLGILKDVKVFSTPEILHAYDATAQGAGAGV